LSGNIIVLLLLVLASNALLRLVKRFHVSSCGKDCAQRPVSKND
jgi:hypothetical protein